MIPIEGHSRTPQATPDLFATTWFGDPVPSYRCIRLRSQWYWWVGHDEWTRLAHFGWLRLRARAQSATQINKKIIEPLDWANQQLSQADLILTIQSCVWTVRLINASNDC